MCSDVMKIDKGLALIMVCDPLQLTPCMLETEHELGNALQGHLQTVQERGFSVKVIHTDPHKSFLKLRTQFPGVVINSGGMKDFV